MSAIILKPKRPLLKPYVRRTGYEFIMRKARPGLIRRLLKAIGLA